LISRDIFTGSGTTLYVNGSNLAITGLANNTQPSDWNVTMFAVNGSVNGLSSDMQVVSGYSTARLGLYTIGTHLSITDMVNYTRSITQLNANLSRT
jgi:hypothetical protein